MAAPKPDAAPVTSAVFPSSRMVPSLDFGDEHPERRQRDPALGLHGIVEAVPVETPERDAARRRPDRLLSAEVEGADEALALPFAPEGQHLALARQERDAALDERGMRAAEAQEGADEVKDGLGVVLLPVGREPEVGGRDGEPGPRVAEARMGRVRLPGER